MGIKNVFSSIFSGLNPVNTIANGLDALFTSDEERLLLKIEEAKVRSSLEIAKIEAIKETSIYQNKVNLAEARSHNWFIAGWRPALGWAFVAIFSYKFLVYPLFSQYFLMVELEIDEILPVLLGMLGLGGLRTIEKYKGFEHNR